MSEEPLYPIPRDWLQDMLDDLEAGEIGRPIEVLRAALKIVDDWAETLED